MNATVLRLLAPFLALLLLGTAAHAQDAANGKVLYNTRYGSQNQGCYSCHGVQGSTLVNTNKIRNGVNNPTLIQSAINNNTGGMGFLGPYLNSTQVADIAAYLGNPGLVGLGTPGAAVSPASLAFAATSVGSSSAAQTVTLSNGGSAALSISSIASSNAAFKVSGGTCAAGGSVAASGSCTVTVVFSPAGAGAASGTLTVTHNASPNTSTVALSGTGVVVAPVAAVSPASLSFNEVVGITSAVQTATISNPGNAALLITALSISGAQASEFTIAAGGTCSAGGSVAAGASCTVRLSFTPAATGARAASLSITHNAAGSPGTVALNGTGTSVPQPVVSLNQNALTFGAQAVGSTSAAQNLTLTNTGSAALQLGSPALSGPQAGEYTLGGTCAAGASIAAGAACTVAVSFAPAATGTRSATLTVASNASNGNATVSLAGTGAPAPAPAVSLSPATLDFGSVTVGAAAVTRTVTLANTGTAALSLAGVSTSGSGFAATPACGSSLAAGASCGITVSFAPTTAGAVSGALSISSDAAGSPHQVALAGQGSTQVLAVLAWSGSTAGSFADLPLGSRAQPLAFTLVNQGPGSASLNAVTVQGVAAADFVPGGTCTAGTLLAQGASCNLTVTFSPSQIGARTAQLDVDSSGTNPAPIVLSGNGIAPAQTTLAVSVPSVTFPVTTVGSPPTPVPVSLSNAGTAALVVTGVSFSSPLLSAQPSAQNGCAALPFTLAPGAQCSLDIALDPSAAGDVVATMTVASNATVNPQPVAVRASVTTGVAGAQISNAGAGGCSLAAPGAVFDPLLLVLAAAAGATAWLRRRRSFSHDESTPGDL